MCRRLYGRSTMSWDIVDLPYILMQKNEMQKKNLLAQWLQYKAVVITSLVVEQHCVVN